MIDIKVLRAMASAGATVEMIMAAAEAMHSTDVEIEAKNSSKKARHAAWKRQRRAASKECNNTVSTGCPSMSTGHEWTSMDIDGHPTAAGTSTMDMSISSENGFPPLIYPPPSIEKKEESIEADHKKRDGRKRQKTEKSSLPEGFTLAAALSCLPDQLGWGSARIQSEFEKFCDYARANNRKYADWPAAWRNWIRSPYQKPEIANGQHKKSVSDVLIEMCETSSRVESENSDWLLQKNGSCGPGDLWEGLSGRSYGISRDDRNGSD